MKRIVIVISVFVLFSITGCSSWMQVVTIDCVDTKTKNDVCYYENDSVLVSYYFWAERGVIGFTVYNKMSIPIYIDWKKCSFIANSTKLDYWVDEETTNMTSYYKGYNFSQDFFKPLVTIPNGQGTTTYGDIFNMGINGGVINSTSKKSKPERITFIPPKSNVSRFSMHLTDFSYVAYDKDIFSEKIVPATYREGKMTKVKVAELTGKNIFLAFRNFLTLSTSENFSREFYIDNEFKVKSITMMRLKQFEGKYCINNDCEYPYRKPSNYYYVYPYDL